MDKSGGRAINPTEPQDNTHASSDMHDIQSNPLRSAPHVEAPPPPSLAASRPKHERHSSREDGEFGKSTDSPARSDIGVRRTSTDSPHNRGVNSGDSHRRGGRISGGSDRSIEQSPRHPHHQAKTPGRGGVSSPLWERKGSNEGSHSLAPLTPGRSRLRSVETPDKGAVVPKFGDWDESDPASADQFTHIFDKVKEEKHTGSVKVPAMPTDTSYPNGSKHDNTENDGLMWCCCFSRSK